MTSGTSLTAAHGAATLLQAGFSVRVAVTSLARAADVREMIAATDADPDEALGFVEADPLSPTFASALAGCDVLVHYEEGPMALDGTRTSGLPGTLAVLEAARSTSITTTIVLRRLDADPLPAELALPTGLTVVHHALPLGPALTPEHLPELQPLIRMYEGRPRYLLPWRYRFVDVRDLVRQIVTIIDPDAASGLGPVSREVVDPELLMLGLAPEPSKAPGRRNSTPPADEPTDGHVFLPGWVTRERHLARVLRDEARRQVDSVPSLVAPVWWVRLRIRMAALVRHRSALAPMGGRELVRFRGDRFPSGQNVTRAWMWEPTPEEDTITDAVTSLLSLDAEAREMDGLAGGGSLGFSR